MDFPIIVLAVLIIGIVKVVTSEPQNATVTAQVTTENGTVQSTSTYVDIPIGNNLGLKKEPGAFTAIVKEMGLIS